jgi:hypothetical protein
MRYTPDVAEKGANRQFRRIKVTVPSLPTVNVTARPGYYPFAPPQ